MTDERDPKKIRENACFILVPTLIFFINLVKFLLDKNSDLPILNNLFLMIVSLFIIIFQIHKSIFGAAHSKGWTQTVLDKYFFKKPDKNK